MARSEPADPERGKAALKPTRIALIVAWAFFMENLDGTIITTALPQMAHAFATTATGLSLGITVYLLALAACIPTSGWAADRYGSRRVFAGAILVFTLSSVLCGLSANAPSFIAARALQGASAALMAPVGRIVVLRTSGPKDLLRSMATITWPGLIAPVLGPPLGGFITTYADWRWIFFINLPIGLVGAALVLAFIPDHRSETPRRFDGVGFLMTAGALGCLIFGLDLVGRRAADLQLWPALVAAGLGLGWAAVRHAMRTPEPLLDLSGLKAPTFALSSITAGSLARISISATPFLLPLLFQIGFGLSAFRAGLLVLVYMGGNLLMKTVTTPVLRRFGFRGVLIVNGLIGAAAIAACGLLSPGTPAPLPYGLLFVAGAARSMNFTAMNTLAFADIEPARKSGATALWGMVQQLAFSLGVALAALALNLSHTVRGATSVGLADFRTAFVFMGGLALVSAVWFARLSPDAGAQVSGRAARPAAPPALSPKLERSS